MRNTYSATLLLFASFASAQGPTPARFIVHTVDGPLSPAPLLHIANDLTVQIAGSQPKVIPGKELVALRQAAAPLPRFLSQNVLLLTNGDRVPVDVKAGWRLQEDRLYFRPGEPLRSPKELDLSVNYASVLCLGEGEGDAEALDQQNVLLMSLLPESRPRDVILFVDGDRLEGNLKSLASNKGEGGAILTVNGKDIVVPLARIKAIAFNTEFKARPRKQGPFRPGDVVGRRPAGLWQDRSRSGRGQNDRHYPVRRGGRSPAGGCAGHHHSPGPGRVSFRSARFAVHF